MAYAAKPFAGDIIWHNKTVCIAAPPTQYTDHNSSAADLWCVPRTDHFSTNIRAVVVFPLNGRPWRRDFHPYHDAMRLWWLLAFAITAKRQGLSVFNGESAHWANRGKPWPWRTVGPIGRALIAALSRHGVLPVPRSGCPACAELRLESVNREHRGEVFRAEDRQRDRFLSLSRATHAVWHTMSSECSATSSPPSPTPLLWWGAAGGVHHALGMSLHSLQEQPAPQAKQATDPRLAALPARIVLLDRMPPRQLAIRGTVRRPMLREVISSNETCATVRQWTLPAFAYVTPHGAQLNNRFLMTQQPQPCLIEVFPLGYLSPCYVLPFCPQRHVQVHGSVVWDAHNRPLAAWQLVKADILKICDKWIPPPASGETGQEKDKRLKRCRIKARGQQVEISNSTLAAAVELCHRAIAPRQRVATTADQQADPAALGLNKDAASTTTANNDADMGQNSLL